MENLADLTPEQLEKQYRDAMSDCRYYHNTDSLSSWREEADKRRSADQRLENLTAEYKRRGQSPPRIP